MGSMLYQRDIHAWAMEQASALREAGRRNLSNLVDWENVAEEIESLGNEQLHALESHLSHVLEHLLKLAYSPALEPRRHWQHEAAVQRTQFLRRLRKNPGLKSRLDELMVAAYEDARDLAEGSLRRDYSVVPVLPISCPFTLEQARDKNWFPDPPGSAGED